MVGFKAAAAAALIAGASAQVVDLASNKASSFRILYQNNLNMTDDVNHMSALLLDPMTYSAAAGACGALNENLLSKTVLMQYKNDFLPQLSYIEYAGYTPSSASQAFWLADNTVVVATQGGSSFKFPAASTYSGQSLPILCTNSQGQALGGNTFGYSQAPANARVTVPAAQGNQYTGFRNQKAFRFNGIRYAANPGRFEYTTVTNATNQKFDAEIFGSQCLQQYGGGSEDCFFLNIQTPFIPNKSVAPKKQSLRPVHFWIHGGGFTGGSGAGYDGDQLASREDVVTVTINYRLTTYGFLAVPGTDAYGNYGIGDQITALNWVIQNIKYFGGDPNQITIAGQSAGAGSVRVLLGSPKAIGLFQGALAESNLGGGHAIGLGGTYSTSYSSYYTISGSYYASGGSALFTQAGCPANETLQQGVDCLRNYAGDLSQLPYQPRYVVQDGTIVNTPILEVATKNNQVAHVPVIFGVADNDGASIGTSYSKTCTNATSCIAADLGISTYWADQIIASGLFPSQDSGNITADSFNVSQRVATDLGFRCVDEATVYAGYASGAFPAAYAYNSDRGFAEDAYNPNGVNDMGVVQPGYPNGNPNTPYYKPHSSDIPDFFGTLNTLRDITDIWALQTSLDHWGNFIREGNPNPAVPMLQIRGDAYAKTVQNIKQQGSWPMVSSPTGPMAHLNWPITITPFNEQEQCTWLNYSINYYLAGGQ